MDKRLVLEMQLFLIVVSVLVACTTTTAIEPDVTPIVNLPNISPTETRTIQPTIMETVTKASPLSTNTAQPTITLTTAPVEEASQILTCSSGPKSLNFVDSFGIAILTRMDFVTEEILEVEGWMSRPRDPDKTPAPSVPPSGQEIPSSNVTLVAGQFNLQDGTSMLLEGIGDEQLLLNPCSDDCVYEILDWTPNKMWQLVQVSERVDDEEGIWLVSESEKVQLVDFVPAWARWQWAADNSLLWFTHPEYEYGLSTSIASLTQPPTIEELPKQDEHPLYTTDFFTAFSSQDKSVLTVRNTYRPDAADRETLYTFDIVQSLSKPVDIQVIPGIRRVQWNEATGSNLLVIFKEDVIEVWENDGSIVVNLPLSIFREKFTNITFQEGEDNSVYEKIVEDSIATSKYALTSIGSRMAVSLGDGRIFLFDCEVNVEQ